MGRDVAATQFAMSSTALYGQLYCKNQLGQSLSNPGLPSVTAVVDKATMKKLSLTKDQLVAFEQLNEKLFPGRTPTTQELAECIGAYAVHSIGTIQRDLERLGRQCAGMDLLVTRVSKSVQDKLLTNLRRTRRKMDETLARLVLWLEGGYSGFEQVSATARYSICMCVMLWCIYVPLLVAEVRHRGSVPLHTPNNAAHA